MRFVISRTSEWRGENAPHPDAYRQDGLKWSTDQRTCKTFAEFDERHSHREGTWLSKGRNHEQLPDRISREVSESGAFWYIDLPDLQALVAFAKANGELVLSCDVEPEIEIYDHYRE